MIRSTMAYYNRPWIIQIRVEVSLQCMCGLMGVSLGVGVCVSVGVSLCLGV